MCLKQPCESRIDINNIESGNKNDENLAKPKATCFRSYFEDLPNKNIKSNNIRFK